MVSVNGIRTAVNPQIKKQRNNKTQTESICQMVSVNGINESEPQRSDSRQSQLNKNKSINLQDVGQNPLSEAWGHPLTTKKPNTIRLLLQNTGGINLYVSGSAKLAALHKFMQEAQVDLAALTKCNVAWHKVDHSLHPSEQTKFWWENAHWSMSNNHQDPHAARYQPGGTGIVVVNQLSYQAQHPGDDVMGLGWWCWARLQGKNNTFLCVVSVC